MQQTEAREITAQYREIAHGQGKLRACLLVFEQSARQAITAGAGELKTLMEESKSRFG